ncbi:MAG: RHS repeat-associated core domain-containing protein, partial [Paludibacteraceae bacterium]|nr:RHS repeat-associated core domain-containing protein [Paludibacteraceae bacterium]
PYLFNAKELDSETGLYYYGARYLDPTSAVWLSVDPLFEKYVGMSPYGYCAGNPVRLIDPNGTLNTTPDGDVVFEPDLSQSLVVSGSQNLNGPDEVSYVRSADGKHIYATNATYQPGFVTTSKGNKVPALKLVSLTLTEVSKELTVIGEPQELLGNEKLQKSLGSSAGRNYAQEAIEAFSSNCHGLAYAKGQVWIEGNDLNTIINDEYNEIGSVSEKNDIITYFSKDNDIPQHSYKKSEECTTGNYISKDGRLKIRWSRFPSDHTYNYNNDNNYSKKYRRK